MTFSSTLKLSVICPVIDNDGLSLQDAIDTVASHLAREAGGVSQYEQQGFWFDEFGQQYSDRSLVLYTFCDEEKIERLSRYFEAWAIQLKQIELLVSVEPARVVFVKGVSAVQAA
jgi:hypothetical protein